MKISFSHHHQVQSPFLTAALLSLGFITACGSGSTATESPVSTSAASKIEAPAQGLARLAFEGEVRFKPAGNHTNRFTITVGQQKHPFGQGLVLMIKEAIVMGDCLKTTVYDFGATTFHIELHGTPSCAPPDQPATVRVSQGESAYQEKLEEVLTLMGKIEESNLVPVPDKTKLKPVRDYLTSLQSTN